jgi:hypothetical protein
MIAAALLLLSSAALCDANSALTPIGVDTNRGQMLFAVPALAPTTGASGEGGRGAIVEWSLGEPGATAYADPGGGWFGGSVGPGEVLAARPCGGGCVQPVRWERGTWQPLGEPFPIPGQVTMGATWDLAGAPWFVAQGPAGPGARPGELRAWAFRREGKEWKDRGHLNVGAVGELQAVPDPDAKDAVLSGTGRFSAQGPPRTWTQALPAVREDQQGQVVALGGDRAAYLAANGAVYLSADTGKTWRRSTWTPWGTGTAGLWRQGTDFWVDLPLGDRRGPLLLAWFDRRVANEEKILLTRYNPDGSAVPLAQDQSEVTTRNDKLPLSHLVSPQPGTWLLLSGCVHTPAGSGLVVRTFQNGALSAARIVPITAAP